MARTAPTAATDRTAPTAAGKLAVAAAFCALAGGLALRLSFLHDEGLFTYDFAAALPHAFLPIVFLIKAKPLLVLLYALPAQLGPRAFLLAHAAVAAGAVLLTAGAAARLGLRPLVAAMMLATSIGFCVAGASGFANSDGAFFLALFLYLHAAGRIGWAGFLLGMLPFVRFELAVTALVFAGFQRRMLITALIFPVVYGLLGAFWHHDLLWLLHSLPNRLQPVGVRRYQAPGAVELLRYLALSLGVNFGVLGVLGLVAWDRRDRRLLPAFVAAAATYLILIGLAGLSLWFAVDRSLRYHLAPLPLVALLAASWRGRAAPIYALQAAALAGALAFTHIGREQHLEDHGLAAAVRASALWRGQPLYSDRQILRYDPCAGVDAWMLANDSIRYEFEQLQGGPALSAALERQRFLVAVGPVRRDALYLIDPERNRGWRDLLDTTQPTTVAVGRYRLYGWP